MHTYDVDALFATVAKNFWIERQRANATGGKNNIRAKGDGPEKAVRDWLSSVLGARYRVTEGHVVRADRWSKIKTDGRYHRLGFRIWNNVW